MIWPPIINASQGAKSNCFTGSLWSYALAFEVVCRWALATLVAKEASFIGDNFSV